MVNLDGTPPAQPELEVTEETQVRSVSLETNASETHEMIIGGDVVPGPRTLSWIPFASTLKVQLLPGDGAKRILVKLRDEVANETAEVSAVTHLNEAAPVVLGSAVNSIPVTETSTFVFSPGSEVEVRFVEDIAEPGLTGTVRITAAEVGFGTGQLPAEGTTNGYTFLWDTTDLLDADYQLELGLQDRYQRQGVDQITISIDSTPPAINVVEINGGASEISNPSATLTLDVEGATEVKLEGDLVVAPETFAWIAWQPTLDVQITSGDGPKRVEALFRDQVGNTTQPVVRTTVLTADTPTDLVVQISDGATTIADQDVSLQLSAVGAAEIFVSGDVSDDLNTFAWVPYVAELPVHLSPGDGLKSVQALFRSPGGLVSPQVVANIQLDREPPEIVSVTSLASATDADNVYRPGQAVLLRVVSTDAGSSLSAAIRIESEDYDSQVQQLALASIQQPGSTEHQFAWNTDGLLEGEYSITATVKDEAGRSVTDTGLQIVMDATPPIDIDVGILGEAETTEKRTLEIALTAEDATLMLVTGDVLPDNNTFLWVPYQDTLTVNLSGGDGSKQLRVRFQDEAGNESRDVTADIYLDQRPPRLLQQVSWSLSRDTGTASLVLPFDESIDGIRPSAFSVKLSNPKRPEVFPLEIRHRQDFILSDNMVLIPLTDDEDAALEALGGRVSSEVLEVTIASGSVRDVAGQRNPGNQENPAVLIPIRLAFATGWASIPAFNGETPWQLVYTPTVSARVVITVRDAAGNDVSTLVDEMQIAGTPQLITWDGGELVEGLYTANVLAEDAQTQQMFLLNQLEISLDTTSPRILESKPRDGGEGPANPRVEFTVEDPVSNETASGIRDVILLVGGQPLLLTPSSEEPSQYLLAQALALPPGEYLLEAQVADQAGNVTETSVRYTSLNIQKPYMINFPNPVSPRQSTTLRYVLPQLAEEGILRIYDAAGMVLFVHPLSVDGLTPGEEHDITWDGIDIFGQPLPRGIYFCELQLTFTDRSEQAIHKLAVR